MSNVVNAYKEVKNTPINLQGLNNSDDINKAKINFYQNNNLNSQESHSNSF